MERERKMEGVETNMKLKPRNDDERDNEREWSLKKKQKKLYGKQLVEKDQVRSHKKKAPPPQDEPVEILEDRLRKRKADEDEALKAALRPNPVHPIKDVTSAVVAYLEQMPKPYFDSVTIADTISLPKRRIYDVLEALQGIEMVKRRKSPEGKLVWVGQKGLINFIKTLPRPKRGTCLILKNLYILTLLRADEDGQWLPLFDSVVHNNRQKLLRLTRAYVACMELGIVESFVQWEGRESGEMLQSVIDTAEGSEYTFDVARIQYDVLNILDALGLVYRSSNTPPQKLRTKDSKKIYYVSGKSRTLATYRYRSPLQPKPLPEVVSVPILQELDVPIPPPLMKLPDLSAISRWDMRNVSYDGITLGDYDDLVMEEMPLVLESFL